MKRFAILAVLVAITGCDKKDAAGSKSAGPPSPVGKWEQRTNPGTPYIYWRYEFKDDHTFTRESGTSSGVVTRKTSGTWSTSSQEAPHYSTGTTLTDDMLRGAGIEPKADRVSG